MKRARLLLLPRLMLLPVAAVLAASAPAAPQMLDDFEAAKRWVASASDGVTGTAAKVSGNKGAAVRLDYDFSRGSGYAVLRRELPLDLSGNFALRFKLRGQGLANALEVKLVDASGDNVWWHRYPDLVPPADWTDFTVKRRQVKFAWGPVSDKTLRRIAAIEFVVAAGKGGGKGWIAVDDLTLERLPEPPAVSPPVTARGEGMKTVDGSLATAWSACGGEPLELDLGYAREFGGMVLRWGPQSAPDYTVALSDDARRWTVASTVRGSDGGTDWIRLPESEARYVRVQPLGNAGRCSLAEVEIKPLEFGETANAFLKEVAKSHGRGRFPRGFVGEQNYWTLVATPEGGVSGLMDESGAVENAPGGVSIEPFVRDGARLVTWADVAATQSLKDGFLPMPTVRWQAPGWALDASSFAAADGNLVARYELENLGSEARSLELVLAVRPLQVNPPQQFLNITGGVSPIEAIRWENGVLNVGTSARVAPATAPDEVKLAAFHSGMLPERLDRPSVTAVEDPTGLASAALIYRVRLAPKERRQFALSLGKPPLAAFSLADAARLEAAAAAEWRERLGAVKLSGPPAAQPTFATLRSALAQMLMSRDGPALRPGSRAYARSWIRDGAMMSDGLLRLGEIRAASDFLNWYAPFQYPSGKIPCCVDPRGADPVPEHDSEGEFIHLVAQLHRYAPDDERSRRLWPRVRAAADYIETLRRKTMVPENRAPERAHFYGLLPPSISHEGYSAKPMHSYWDDFWALGGLHDGAWLAGQLGLPAEAAILTGRANAFEADVLASIGKATRIHDIAFIPGSADLGDFDATSTTVALSIAGVQADLPPDALRATFQRYWQEVTARRDGRKAWDVYTPYEWRNVGAFVRLGWRDRANALADFLMKDRRPAEWNQWAEVVGRNPREPRFLGDMPHGWVASDFINAALDMLAYERQRDGALVLAAGVPQSWVEGEGLSVERLRTPYGPLAFTLRRVGDRVRLTYALAGQPPAGGLVLAAPGTAGERRLASNRGTIELPFKPTPNPSHRPIAQASGNPRK